MWELLRTFSWRELRFHPWRNAAAVVAVTLGVALALSVHLINASALSEFSNALRTVNGQPDLSLRATAAGFDETLYGELARHPAVAYASPVVEVNTFGVLEFAQGESENKGQGQGQDQAERLPLRVLGVDALLVAHVAPGLLPHADGVNGADSTDRFSIFAPDAVFLNPSAVQWAQKSTQKVTGLRVQSGMRLPLLRIAGTVGGETTEEARSPPMLVMDIAAVQELFGKIGQLTRIDVRLVQGADREAFLRDIQALPGFAGQVRVADPDDARQRIGALSKAYRVNLTVLALVALFTGAFLVFSVLSLSVAKRAQQFALLGVLGMTPGQRLRLVLMESVVLGVVGSGLGVALGAVLAATALRLLGGDLGGGYFAGVTPTLQWDGLAALTFASLGVEAAAIGGWWPARQAQRLPPAQTLKGLGLAYAPPGRMRWVGLLMIAAGAALATLPPVFDLPLAAYGSVAFILLGGVTVLPAGIALLYDVIRPLMTRQVLPLLAIERARRQRETAAVAISGVVAALSLAVALTVMVTSFRQSVTRWLDVVLPADLYVRMANSSTAGDSVYFEPEFVRSVAELPEVKRLVAIRVSTLQIEPTRPAVALIARPLADPVGTLPMVESPVNLPSTLGDAVPVYVSEAFADLYNVQPGKYFKPFSTSSQVGYTSSATLSGANLFVAGVWRDYARQHGTIAIDSADFARLSGDYRVNDLALWLKDANNPQAVQAVQADIRQLAQLSAASQAAADVKDKTQGEDANAASQLLEFSSAAQIRASSLNIFDRSFAVTYWLQGVAIAIGLFGVAASFSAQVLARRKEFGLLAHLGLTKRQILTVVAGEGLVWTGIGALAGLLLGIAVAVVLVKVVNPQSFHWSMDLALPWLRLGSLCASVVLAGTLTAWLAGRAAASQQAVLAVKEDW